MLCIGKPYMITLNVDVSDGLVNGSVGTLKFIENDTHGKPLRIWLQFGELGSKLAIGTVAAAKSHQLRKLNRNIQPNWMPIERRTVTCVIDKKTKVSVRRCQLHVVQASAITIHKSQGGTYDEVVYSYAKNHPQKLVYVALSRATDINGLYLTNVDNDFTFYHGKANPDRKLADEFRRLQSHKLDTITAKCLAMTEQPHYLLISALNVRSLAAHAKDVHHDHILRHSSVLCFAETWMDPEEPLEIIDFLYCCGARRDHNRAAGVAIYLRTGLSAIPVEMFGTSHEVVELCAAKLPNGLLVVAAYFAPTALTKDVVHCLQLALTVHRSTPMLVVGDFNVDIKTNSNFLTLMRENIPFLSLVTRPTAVTTSRGTCIDLVFENQALVYQVEHISVYFSDHKASFMTVKNC
ncbi:uncharacterized protein [Dermacentor albipictus]|uniref:uncharacterized protein n=1 Tax=Dermacentor albipictus TaxID=60249 RepID=UPI0038FCDE36